MTPPRQDHFPRRRGQRRKAKRTILIAVEGKVTERLYFDALKRTDVVKEHCAVTIISGKGGSRLRIAEEAIGKRDDSEGDFDEAWLVLDTERLTSAEAMADFRKAKTLAKKKGFSVAASNPSFEVWLLAHFTRSARQFADANAVISELTQHWRKTFNREYGKGDEAGLREITARTQDALLHARDVRQKHHGAKSDICDCNSATELYLLVERLLGLDDAGGKGGPKRRTKAKGSR